jgi:recombination protein RecT
MTTALDRVGQQSAPPTVTEFIGQLVPEIQRALPAGMDGDRIARLALTVVRKDRALQNCDPLSFAGALLTAAALGLEVGTGEAHLVAYGKECTFIPDYKGLSKLFFQHPLARHLDCQVVYENDTFDYAYGLDPFLTHKPARGDRGAIHAYYAVAALSTGAKAFVVLTPEDCKALRGGKVGPDARFKGGDPMHWMERKTALKQLMKLLPKSTTLQRALEADEKSGSELHRDRAIEARSSTAAIEAAPVDVDPATGVVLDPADQTGGADPDTDAAWPETAKPADA